MHSTHTPSRTCVGCRLVDSPDQMIRVVREGQDLLVDHGKAAHGRGAWVHPAASCVEQAVQRGGFQRSFRTLVSTAALERQLESIVRPTRGAEPIFGSGITPMDIR